MADTLLAELKPLVDNSSRSSRDGSSSFFVAITRTRFIKSLSYISEIGVEMVHYDSAFTLKVRPRLVQSVAMLSFLAGCCDCHLKYRAKEQARFALAFVSYLAG